MDRRIILTSLLVLLLLAGVSQATTYYVSKTGSDANAGTSWGAAILTISKVNSLTGGGDTTYFGTGVWRDTILLSKPGTYSDRTVYACSSFVDTNGSGEYHFAKLYGSDSLTGWTLHSGNIYKTYWASPLDTHQVLYQGDSLVWRKNSIANIVAEGQWYYTSAVGSLYVRAYGNGDPDNYAMELPRGMIIDLDSSNQNSSYASDYVTFYGLQMKYAQGVIAQVDFGADDNNIDSVFFINCKMSHAAGWTGYNQGSLIYTGGSGSAGNVGNYNMVRACSLSYVWAVYRDEANDTWVDYTTHGAALMFYLQKNMIIDSNTFYGHLAKGGIFFKAAYATVGGYSTDSNIIRYNTFNDFDHDAYAIVLFGYWKNLQVYGNVFSNISKGGINSYYTDGSVSDVIRPNFAGPLFVYNNTFYNVGSPLWEGLAGTPVTDPPINQEWKYNIMSNSGTLDFAVGGWCGDSGWVDIDSNIWDTGGVLTLRKDGGTGAWDAGVPITITGWVDTAGFDSNSFKWNVDPTFSDASNGDFSRLSVSSEMYKIYPDGWHATIFGAIQPDQDTIPRNQITDISVINITDSSATIKWTSSYPSTSQVKYGISPSLNLATSTDPSYLTSHSINLTSLQPNSTYAFQSVSIDTLNRVKYSITSNFQTSSTGGSPSINLALGIIPTVNTTYTGYAPSKLTDGQKDPYGLESTTWVSDESVSSSHWIDIDFGEEKTVEQIVFDWAWNPVRSTWMTSQQLQIQNWNGSGYDTVIVVNNPPVDSVTILNVGPLTSSRIRIYQPANQGPAPYPVVIWLAELEVWGTDLIATGFSPESSTSTYAYPNPFQPSLHGSLTIDHIPVGASLIILDVAGNTIRRFPDIRSGSVAWDGRNDLSSSVSSGVYLWYLENSGQKGKIVLVN